MTVTCYVTEGKKKALKICTAFAKGCGGRVQETHVPSLLPGPAFFYGWTAYTYPLMVQCMDEGRDWYYCDNAYYFGKEQYFRVTKNALMHDGSGPGVCKTTLPVPIKPWRKQGQHIIIGTQSEGFYTLRLGQTREQWVEAIISELKSYSQRPIVVCHKPSRWKGRPHPHENFEAQLPGAWAVVSHSSSIMVKALVEGVPVFSVAPSMASMMGRSDLSLIEQPVYPDGRDVWFANLLANQWTYDHLENGTCWRELKHQEPVNFDLARFCQRRVKRS